MAIWTVPKEDMHPKKPEPPKAHRPPHEATYEGLAHISRQIEELRQAVARLEEKIDQKR